ncbi:DUF1285 domain-containing protein [Martelella lutilitoris]|uniref:DUF1285 domain-containing protein n=1 Tax=Martelella lutilitoris TaxID=2583532 RepID=A0A5C4JVV9_9HYPH|nr:DUF1285 domain-containing protein [Martelella lutilitoris]TNB49317.1 DUF1285 domain-containing protein [Martelella lutilitoris]
MTDGTQPSTGGASGLASAIARQLEGGGKRAPAPVEKWDPPFCGDLDMEIRRDGTWFYQGTPIGRAALAHLFSTVLRKDDDGETYLVTPVEKVRIRVEDAPFVAVTMTVSGKGEEQLLSVRTNMGDVVEIGAGHPLRFNVSGENAELKPYVRVRGRLEALFSRALTYDLVALGEEVEIDGRAMFAVRSAGALFPVMEMAKLEKAL